MKFQLIPKSVGNEQWTEEFLCHKNTSFFLGKFLTKRTTMYMKMCISFFLSDLFLSYVESFSDRLHHDHRDILYIKVHFLSFSRCVRHVLLEKIFILYFQFRIESSRIVYCSLWNSCALRHVVQGDFKDFSWWSRNVLANNIYLNSFPSKMKNACISRILTKFSSDFIRYMYQIFTLYTKFK